MTYPAPDKDKMPKDDWFGDTPHPHDSMPVAKNYASRHESTPDHEKGAEEVVTMHEKMYRMATENGGGSWQGGSEEIHK